MGIIDHLQRKPGQYYVRNIKTEVLKTSAPSFSENEVRVLQRKGTKDFS